MIEKFVAWVNNFNMRFSWPARIACGVIILVIVLAAVLGTFLPQAQESKAPEDTNVYLNEEVCFARDIYIKVVGISVSTNEDKDAPYTLNLTLNVEQKSEGKGHNTTIKPSLFKLKSVNVKSKSPMSVFFSTMASATAQAMLSIAVGGDINILEETVDFALNYATEVSENVADETKLKAIKLDDEAFGSFKPKELGEAREIKISFPITKEHLESENTIVLNIDSFNHVERRIYLITRPEIQENTEE